MVVTIACGDLLSFCRPGVAISCGVSRRRYGYQEQTVFFFEEAGADSGVTTAITFLAQWHPLINPIRSDLRPENTHQEGLGGAARFF